MKQKRSRKKAGVTTKGRKKSRFSNLWFIIIAVLIALIFVVFSIYSPKSERAGGNKASSSVNKAPSFRKDGQVKILTGSVPLEVDVEIADNDDTRQRGLMYRYNMEEFQGMFFVFPYEDYRSFWMKNTYLSLDIIYINANNEIVSIQKYTQPKSTYSLPSEKPAKYVLEVNAGFTDKYQIKPGDKIELEE